MLSKGQIQICNLMGINPHEFIEMNAEQLPAMATAAKEEEKQQQARIAEAENEFMRLMKISPVQFESMKSKQQIGLTAEEMDVCKAVGIRPVEFLHRKMVEAGFEGYPQLV